MLMYCLFAALVAASECPTSSCHPATLLVPLPAEINLSECTATSEGPLSTGIDPTLIHLGDEGYELHAHQEGYRIVARTERGLFYGKQTAEQMKQLGLVPCSTIVDKPAMKVRAVMLDLARLKEKHEYYYHVIDRLARWKINTVFLHLTDHSGCALEFKRYPSLTSKYAFTQGEMKRLIRYAADRHIEIIPEIETWGHAKYITRVPEFADLAEDPNDPRALCTSNPRTWEVLGNMIDEVAALFPSRYIHAGCDEAAFGKCAECTAKIERAGKGALVGEHLRKVCELVKARGKTPMIWGDVLLQHRESVDVVPRDAVICHWEYKPQVPDEPVKFLREKGFEVIGSSALVWGSRMILPRTDTLDNVESYAKVIADNNCLGMETTVWVPQRYVTDTLSPALAYAAEMSWSGPRRTRLEFAAAFAKSHFGMDPTTELARAILDVHSLSMKSFAKLLDPWEYTRECAAKPDDELTAEPAPEMDQARSISHLLAALRPRVTSNDQEYDALILSADIRRYTEARAVAIHALVKSTRSFEGATGQKNASVALPKLIDVFEDLRKENESLTRRTEAAWDRWRYADDPKKTDGGENLLGGFYAGRRFLDDILTRLKDAQARTMKGETVDWKGLIRKPDPKAQSFSDTGDVSPQPT